MFEPTLMSIFFIILFISTCVVIKDYAAEKVKDKESDITKNYKQMTIYLVIATSFAGMSAMDNIYNYFQSADYTFVKISSHGLISILLPFGVSAFVLYKSSRHYLKYKELKREKIKNPEEPKGYDELGEKMSNEIDYSRVYLIFGCFFFLMSNVFFFKGTDYSQKYTCIDNVLYTNISDEYTFEPSKDYKKYLCTTQEKMEEHITKDDVIYNLMRYHRLFEIPVIDAITNQPIFLGKSIKINQVE